MLVNITVNGKTQDFKEAVSNEFGELIEAYNFKDYDEVNKVLYWDYRCKMKNYFDWCPADSKALREYLTREEEKI